MVGIIAALKRNLVNCTMGTVMATKIVPLDHILCLLLIELFNYARVLDGMVCGSNNCVNQIFQGETPNYFLHNDA